MEDSKYIAMEFYGRADSPDDRPLGSDGLFASRSECRAPGWTVATFPSREAALAAGEAANRRSGGCIGSFSPAPRI